MTEATTKPWAVIQDQYGNAGIADSMGDWIVEQVESVEYADLIVNAVNNHDALVAALRSVIHYVETGDALTHIDRLIRIVAISSAALEAAE